MLKHRITFIQIPTIALFCLMFIPLAMAGTTGKIAGRIVDATTTHEPLIAANVMIEGTSLGAASDYEGNYFIINIPPGEYTIKALFIGYTPIVMNNVKVSVDQTTKINFNMQQETLMGETVVAIAERPIVQQDLTSTMSKVSSDEIASLPIEDVAGVVNLQAGVVDGHFRGGRSSEVKYLIDGVAVNDVFSGDFSMEADVNSIQEIQVLSGTFNAEYGEALSGVVNQITKAPADQYHIDISSYSGDYVSNRTGVFKHIDHISPKDVYNFQGSLSGPAPMLGDYLKFYVSGRYLNDQGAIYGQRIFNPWDYSNFTDNNPANWYVGATGDSASVPMNYSIRTNLQGKVYIRVGKANWIVLQGMYQNKDYMDYEHEYQLNPDGAYKRYQTGTLGSASYTLVFSPSTFMDMKVSAFKTNYEQYAHKNPFDRGYVDPAMKDYVSGNAFLTAGSENWQFSHTTLTTTGKIDLTSQLNNVHQIKTGVEVQLHDLDYKDFQIAVNAIYDNNGNITGFTRSLPKPGALDYNTYNSHPYQYASYIQDKIELDYLIVNFGVRFDYFEPDGNVLKNPDNIAALDAQQQPYADSLFEKATAKYQFSPRIGISYPMSDRGAIHVSYGHFFQVPPFEYLYRNPNYRIPLTGDFPEFVGQTIGNPDLQPQRTTVYEIGLQQEIITDIGITATAYYKDIRNLLGQEIHLKNNFKKFGKYINRDYGSVRGVTISLEKRMRNKFGASIDYTYQIAKGNASDPNAEFENAQRNPPVATNKQLVPLNWDRRNSLNFTVTVVTPGDFVSSLIGKLGSGLPYTPSLQDQRTGLENSENRPTFFNLDLYITKDLKPLGLNASVFIKAYNLLDLANEIEVFGDTGRAGYTLELTRSQEPPRGVNTLKDFYTRPDYYSQPRQVIVGVSFEY
ncbi:TonB-dependent receptor [candidate division KSB1 bacterium]|nr:TonB-dependent receptor [candidate division KSB1 bacterium]